MQGGIVDRKEYQEFIFDRLSALPLSCVLHPLTVYILVMPEAFLAPYQEVLLSTKDCAS